MRLAGRLRQTADYLKEGLQRDLAFPPLPDGDGLEAHLDELSRRYERLRGAVPEPAVSVVIPVHVIETNETFLRALTSLLSITDAPPTEVIIVLSGKETTPRMLSSDLHRLSTRIGLQTLTLSYVEDPRYHGIKRPLNVFFAKQKGFEAARGGIVIVTDIDCAFAPRWIRAYVDAFASDPGLLGAYGPVQNYGSTGVVGRAMIVTSTIMKALKILVDYPPFAGHNHAMRRELRDRIPDLYGRIGYANNNALGGIIARELSTKRDVTDFIRCIPGALVTTYFPKQTESLAKAIHWFFSAARRNLRAFFRLRRNKSLSVARKTEGWGRSAEGQRSSAEPDASDGSARLGYVMSRFPKLSETFILREIVTLRRLGVPVEIYPLLNQQQAIRHPEAEQVAAGAHYHPFLSTAVVAANWHYVWTRPGAYARMVWDVLAGTIRSPKHFSRALALLPKAAYLAREMTRSGVTHVHAHFSNHPALVALVVHRLTGIPYSFTAHGSDLHVDQSFLATKIRESAFAVTISDYNKEFMVETCGEELREKVLVIRCGVDPAVFRPGPRTHDGPFQILCVGSLGPVKGHRYLIEACRILRNRGVSFECHIVGEGELRGDIERWVADADLSDRVTLHGARRQEDVVSRMRAADAMALPSVMRSRGDREGIPVVLMEAMAAGLPVVSSKLSGIPELVVDGETGILAAPGDSAGIADALHTLARDAELRVRLGKAGRERVIERFDLETNVRQLCDQFVSRHAARPATPCAGGQRVLSRRIAE